MAFSLVCDVTSGGCVECLNDMGCMNGRKCRLSDHSCVRGCMANTDCNNGRTCDTQTGTCVECTTDAQCMGRKCDPTTRSCVACLASTDCQQGMICSGGDCSPGCTSNMQCGGGMGGGRGGVCALGLGVCVECVDNSQCGDMGYCQPDHTCGGGN
jgi:Cys-rich repeat protein